MQETLSKIVYGNQLAKYVANRLLMGHNLINDHRDYCGKGFVCINKQIQYVTVNDGYLFYNQVIFATTGEFVKWLAQQSDYSMAGLEEDVEWMIGNQRITLERLDKFIES